MRVLFVCLGNICRSPRVCQHFAQVGFGQRVEVASAGTEGFDLVEFGCRGLVDEVKGRP